MYISKERFNKNNNNIASNESIYSQRMKKLYKEIKEEIKNIVITKLHNQVQKLIKELNNLNKENLIIKNDLIYILKRILNNKAEYNNTNTNYNIYNNNNFRNNSCINLNSNISPNNANSSSITLNKSLLSSEINVNCNNNYNNYNNRNTSRTKINIMKTQDNIGNILDSEQSKYFLDKNKFKNIDNKIDSYLNSLYKHNCIGNHIGYENNYNLNKSKGIYDELFNTQGSVYDNNNNKNNGGNHKTKKKFNISIDEKIGKGKSSSIKKLKNSHKYKNIIYNHKKKRLQYKDIIDKKEDYNMDGSFSCRNIKEKKYLTKDKDNGTNKNENGNFISNKNSNPKMKIIHTNRSPFLVKKF
jgi:hypothetical protein